MPQALLHDLLPSMFDSPLFAAQPALEQMENIEQEGRPTWVTRQRKREDLR
jgi:hypothetical protein